jgi:hypothetical protein
MVFVIWECVLFREALKYVWKRNLPGEEKLS